MIILKRSIPSICRYYLCPSVIDPDFGLSHIKVKTSNWLQRQKNPADTFVFNNAVVGSTMLRYITDPKVSLSASGQCYRLSWVCSLINENVHYMHTEKWLQHLQEDRQPQAFCGFWQLGAMNVCCLFFFLNHSVKWTHSANEGKKKKERKHYSQLGWEKSSLSVRLSWWLKGSFLAFDVGGFILCIPPFLP